jgi:integrase
VSAIFLPTNMLIRNDTYHYRRRIPADLFHLFGKKELTKSLHTKLPLDAVRFKNRLDGQLEQLFQACRIEAVTAATAQARLQSILGHKPIPPAEPTTQPILIIPSRRRGKRLSDAVEAYCKENQVTWASKTIREFSGIFTRMIKDLSDPYLNDIVRPALVSYRDKLLADGKHPKTVSKYLQLLSTTLRYAGRLKWITGNPAEGLTIKETRREDDIRRPYTINEINFIFLALQRDKSIFYESGHHENYWLPLLGMYTGARVNELAQLLVNDIEIIENIPAIKITSIGDNDKRLKTDTARRTLPIHRDLLTLGFLVYVKNIKDKGSERLFPSLKLGPNGYSHYFVSRHFSGKKGWLRTVLPDLEDGVAFHSFRHLITLSLKNLEIPETQIQEIIGHKVTSLAMGRYGKPFDASILLRAINQIEFGLIPRPVQGQQLIKTPDDHYESLDVYTLGDNYVVDEGSDEPLEIKQFKRPDLYGYSIFHDSIPSFNKD